jgi:hypothetical protein
MQRNVARITDAELMMRIEVLAERADAAPPNATLPPERIAALRAIAVELREATDAQALARAAAKAATLRKEAVAEEAREEFRLAGHWIQGNLPESVELALAAGVGPRAPKRQRIVPHAPDRLVAMPIPGGGVRLTWDRNGNLYRTSYVIEARLPGDDEFRFLTITTRTSWTHAEVVPGQRVEYRVRAHRTEHETAWSNTAVVYG